MIHLVFSFRIKWYKNIFKILNYTFDFAYSQYGNLEFTPLNLIHNMMYIHYWDDVCMEIEYKRTLGLYENLLAHIVASFEKEQSIPYNSIFEIFPTMHI